VPVETRSGFLAARLAAALPRSSRA
jgi:hypothetical protein